MNLENKIGLISTKGIKIKLQVVFVNLVADLYYTQRIMDKT